MIDGNGVVKNTIVVGDDWDLGGVPCGEYTVGIGDVYNFTDKKFYKADGSLVKTYAEIEAECQMIRDKYVTDAN